MEHIMWWAGIFVLAAMAAGFAIVQWEPKANPGSWLVADDWRGRVGRFLVDLNGKVSGLADLNLTRKFILEDVRCCRRSMTVLIPDAHQVFLADDVLQAIEESKAVHGDEVCFRFIVGPDMENRNLERLAELGLVVLNRLRKNPPYSVRIVDQNIVHIVTNNDPNKLLRYERTYGNCGLFGDSGALKEYSDLINQILLENWATSPAA